MPFIAEKQTYNIVKVTREGFGAMDFVETFDCDQFIFDDAHGLSVALRNPNLFPVMFSQWNEIYSETGKPGVGNHPFLQGKPILGTGSRLDVDNKFRIFFLRMFRVDFSSGLLDVFGWGGEDLGNLIDGKVGAFPLIKRNSVGYRSFNKRMAG